MNARVADISSSSRGIPGVSMPILLDFRADPCLHVGSDVEAEELATHSHQGGTEP